MLNKLGKFNYIYKPFNVFCASNPFVACIHIDYLIKYRFFRRMNKLHMNIQSELRKT